MNNFDHIQQKLQNFIYKYYWNEIIKGSILFGSFGLLYLIFTLFVEYFLWLDPLARTILFWLFVVVECALLTKFIFIPVLKLIGLKKGIPVREASRIIGKHFKEVDDKLLNVIELQDSYKKDTNKASDLLLASIEQKSADLDPVPFKSAIDLAANSKYIKYLIIPIAIWLLTIISGNNSIFTQSLDRVVHHNTVFMQPAPFQFRLLNDHLKIIEGQRLQLQVQTVGDIVPQNISINFNQESYYLNANNQGVFTYEFVGATEDIDFYLEANEIVSTDYTLEVISAPRIIDFQMFLNYPAYTGKNQETIKNTGNATLPEGTEITWNITSQNTEYMHFIATNNKWQEAEEKLSGDANGIFSLTKNIANNVSYKIATSNADLEKFEILTYQLRVIKDQYPVIKVQSDIDSVSRGPVQFAGQLSDDYGINKLQIVARNLIDQKVNYANIVIGKSDFEEFYYVFPSGLVLEEGVDYEIHFEVFDNDGIHGSKKSSSEIFYYHSKTQNEIDDELLFEQNQEIENLENTSKNAEEVQKKLADFTKKLKSKSNADWSDKKELDGYLERQQKYQQMLKENTNTLLENLKEMDEEENKVLKEKKQHLLDRMDENAKEQEQQKLWNELKKLAEKLKKEDLLEKIDKLTEQTKQETRTLERLLELTKRFYVEKKAAQLMKKLDSLSKEQKALSKSKINTSEKQEDLNKEFDSIAKDLKEMEEQNQQLNQPLELENTKADQKLIEMEMEDAKKALEKMERSDPSIHSDSEQRAKKKQQQAAKKMQELSNKLKSDMLAMEMESNEENIDDLKQILENLITFSFEQEALMLSMKGLDAKNADYPEKLKQQVHLKENFEHIDDSLYTLSLRLVQLSTKIQKDLTDAHYNLDKSLENIVDNKINQGTTNQHYTMTAANNLADLLSDLLQSLQNKQPGSGKGKDKESWNLPDIIKKQGELVKQIKHGSKPDKKEGNNNKESMSGEQFQIYMEQNRLKEALRSLINAGENKGEEPQKIMNKMEALEKLLLEKGITKEVLNRMQQLEYELLKLENASLEQHKDVKRKSKSGDAIRSKEKARTIFLKKIFYQEDEILMRQNLDLQPLYQDKIKTYFKN